jgi:hypothetical protein
MASLALASLASPNQIKSNQREAIWQSQIASLASSPQSGGPLHREAVWLRQSSALHREADGFANEKRRGEARCVALHKARCVALHPLCGEAVGSAFTLLLSALRCIGEAKRRCGEPALLAQQARKERKKLDSNQQSFTGTNLPNWRNNHSAIFPIIKKNKYE